MQHFSDKYSSSGHFYLARIPGIDESQRNILIARMAERGVATNVHYKPLPMFTAYKRMGFNISEFPNAFAMYENDIYSTSSYQLHR
jgi:dTDP-4-amino-4,6-dideoxygalactose transaminase